ncbi:uncharacterized protein A4U43_C08F35940 [Asparagus officinalis]|uniref:protein NRT1/ PTR FAMILY 5.6-like n=1 Tax=Asparagus officinalis TaxID=4686 RepID=UPI00098E0602|nr:protein NRT1/ PTR FAMILY 5.6-like [Asparagus officinalis]ONK62017.1 uncharacterized protein A4U43_C08F35940 [Asparagus officinalis]
MEIRRREELEDDNEKWVRDSSVDHRGNTPLRAFTGVWKASFFIIVFEFAEKLCAFGLSSNLIIYLTKVLHQDLKTAAKNVNYWGGVSTMTPLIGGFIADTYLGRFYMVLLSSAIYLAGLFLLSMSQFIPSLKPTKSLNLHKVVFYIAMFMTSIASGGYKPGIQSFGADQFDESHINERKKKMSFFDWWNFGLCSGMLLGVTVISYVEDNVSWGFGYSFMALVMFISFSVFIFGRKYYRYQHPKGSPLTPLIQVLVAAMSKRHLVLPSDAKHLYEVAEPAKCDRRLLCHTDRFRFLEKAAIIEHQYDNIAFEAEKLNRWRLSSVTQVEEMKLILSIIPIWLTSLAFNISFAETPLFIKQASIGNTKISTGFNIPPASLFSLLAISMIITIIFFDKILEPCLRRIKRKDRGISILQRIGIGMVFSITAMIVAGIIENERLEDGAFMSIFRLFPQFMIMGLADGFTIVGLQEFFYDQVPDNMRSLGMALYFSNVGVANFLGSMLITLVDNVTRRGGNNSWFAKDLNGSRLDKFYWLLAGINAVNLCVYIFVASRHTYKSVRVKVSKDETVRVPEREDNNDHV